MSTRIDVDPEPLTEERDLRKPGLRSRSFVRDPIQRTSEATAELFSGLAEAISKAFRSFGGEINADNVARISLSNGFIAGTAAAQASFFDELSDTSRRVYETLKSSEDERRAATTEPIDYERLARLVAAEIMQAQIIAQVREAEARAASAKVEGTEVREPRGV